MTRFRGPRSALARTALPWSVMDATAPADRSGNAAARSRNSTKPPRYGPPYPRRSADARLALLSGGEAVGFISGARARRFAVPCVAGRCYPEAATARHREWRAERSCSVGARRGIARGSAENPRIVRAIPGVRPTTPTGRDWPDPGNYSTASDLALLSRRADPDFPEHYKLYSERANTATTTSRSKTATGSCGSIRTWTASRPAIRRAPATPHRLGEARRASGVGGHRLAFGAPARPGEQKLLNFGFQSYDGVRLYQRARRSASSRCGRQRAELKAGVAADLYVTVPRAPRTGCRRTLQPAAARCSRLPRGSAPRRCACRSRRAR